MQQFLESWFAECRDGSMPKLAEVSMDTRAYWHSTLSQAKGGQLEAWGKNPPGRLSLIIIFGPLARLVDDVECERWHQHAKKLCLGGIEFGFDTQLSVMQRRYFYDPLFVTQVEQERQLLQRLLSGMRAQTAGHSLNLWQSWYQQATTDQSSALAC